MFPNRRMHGRDAMPFQARGRGGFRSNNWGRPPRKQSPDEEPQGTLFETIKPVGLTQASRVADRGPLDAGARCKISAVEYMASYNWFEKEEATVIVPGAPPRWTPPRQVPLLNEDSGDYFRDPNAARWARYPCEPLVHALFETRTDFEPGQIDIVGCGSTLGNLLRFASGLNRSFHFKAERVGNTLFLVRQERSPKALLEGVYGYGHSYPEAYTTWDRDVRGSASHQRLVKYSFGGLGILVRSETDGYLEEKASLKDAGKTNRSASKPSEVEIDEVLSSLEGSRVKAGRPVSSRSLKIERSHTPPVPQSAIFDIKTRSARTEYDMEEILPRLWLNRTPNFILAQHNRGHFQEPRVLDVREDVARWETRNERALQRFLEILHKLIKAVDDLHGKKVGVWRRGGGPLEFRLLDDDKWSALPKKLKAKWTSSSDEDEGASGAESDEPDSDHSNDSFLAFFK